MIQWCEWIPNVIQLSITCTGLGSRTILCNDMDVYDISKWDIVYIYMIVIHGYVKPIYEYCNQYHHENIINDAVI